MKIKKIIRLILGKHFSAIIDDAYAFLVNPDARKVSLCFYPSGRPLSIEDVKKSTSDEGFVFCSEEDKKIFEKTKTDILKLCESDSKITLTSFAKIRNAFPHLDDMQELCGLWKYEHDIDCIAANKIKIQFNQ